MKNTLTDMHNILMEQLERLNDDELDDTQLAKEMTRAKGMAEIASCIVENSNVILKAAKLNYDMGNSGEVSNILIGSSNAAK